MFNYSDTVRRSRKHPDSRNRKLSYNIRVVVSGYCELARIGYFGSFGYQCCVLIAFQRYLRHIELKNIREYDTIDQIVIIGSSVLFAE